MATKTIVSMNAQGRMTVPAEARRALRVEGETQFELEITENALILRPAVVIPREEAWAYTPAHRQLIEAALEDAREGRVTRLTKAELERLAVQ